MILNMTMLSNCSLVHLRIRHPNYVNEVNNRAMANIANNKLKLM